MPAVIRVVKLLRLSRKAEGVTRPGRPWIDPPPCISNLLTYPPRAALINRSPSRPLNSDHAEDSRKSEEYNVRISSEIRVLHGRLRFLSGCPCIDFHLNTI